MALLHHGHDRSPGVLLGGDIPGDEDSRIVTQQEQNDNTARRRPGTRTVLAIGGGALVVGSAITVPLVLHGGSGTTESHAAKNPGNSAKPFPGSGAASAGAEQSTLKLDGTTDWCKSIGTSVVTRVFGAEFGPNAGDVSCAGGQYTPGSADGTVVDAQWTAEGGSLTVDLTAKRPDAGITVQSMTEAATAQGVFVQPMTVDGTHMEVYVYSGEATALYQAGSYIVEATVEGSTAQNLPPDALDNVGEFAGQALAVPGLINH